MIDAHGKYVVPGGVDAHVHMSLPFGGTISADETWTAAEVHRITDDVIVAEGVTLTVEPGTMVRLELVFAAEERTLYIRGVVRWRRAQGTRELATGIVAALVASRIPSLRADT